MKHSLYGWTGFLSLLGLIGVFTDQRVFLAFFAFAVDFEFFFLPSDEMLDAYMRRAACAAFYAGMFTVALVTLLGVFVGRQAGQAALAAGMACGWAAAVVVHAVSVACCQFREGWGLHR